MVILFLTNSATNATKSFRKVLHFKNTFEHIREQNLIYAIIQVAAKHFLKYIQVLLTLVRALIL